MGFCVVHSHSGLEMKKREIEQYQSDLVSFVMQFGLVSNFRKLLYCYQKNENERKPNPALAPESQKQRP